jgi:hypothetical protein
VNVPTGIDHPTEAEDVLTVDDYGAIRRARRDGMSIRQISREFGHTRKTVRHVLDHAEPPAPINRDRKAPLLGTVEPIIDRMRLTDHTSTHFGALTGLLAVLLESVG